MNLIVLNDEKLSKISSEFCLKKVFSYLNYKTTLQIAKNNRELQKKLGINLQNYKTESNYGYVERKIRMASGQSAYDASFQSMSLLITGCMSVTFLLYFITYTILLVTMNLFNETNSKDNYDKDYIDIINKINNSLFILIFIVICSFYVLNYFIFKDFDIDTNLRKYLKTTILIVIILIHFTYERLVIWKLALSYDIKKDSITWFMVLDYLFIVFNFIYIIYLVITAILYYISSGESISNKTDFFLTTFKDIKVNYFLLPDFNVLNRKEKLNFIYRNIKNIELFISEEEIDLIFLINNFRKKNNVQILSMSKRKRLPSFIVNPPSEIILLSYKHIFQFKNNSYLLRYQIGEFENKLKNNDKEITNILLKENLNRIIVLRQGNIQNICVFESYNAFETGFEPSTKKDLDYYNKNDYYYFKFEDKYHTI